MKETTIGLKALNLYDAALALAGILDQALEGNCIKVNYQYACKLICSMQAVAKSAADELMLIDEERKEAKS